MGSSTSSVLAGGVDAWEDAGRTLATTPLLEASRTDGRQVLDIRQQTEFVVEARSTLPARRAA